MSAITGIGDSTAILFRASTSFSRGTAQRTRSPPASAIAWICFMVASKSAVSVFVIDCTATGAPPPILTPPTSIWRLEGTYTAYLPTPRASEVEVVRRDRARPRRTGLLLLDSVGPVDRVDRSDADVARLNGLVRTGR